MLLSLLLLPFLCKNTFTGSSKFEERQSVDDNFKRLMIVLRSCIVDLGGGRKENRATWKGRKMIVFLFVYISKIFHSIFDIHFYSTFMVVTHDQNKHCFLHHVFPHIPLSCAIYDPRRSVERKQLVC